MVKAYSYTRMSTSEQLKGDSLRRQLQQSQEYAAANGLELVEKDQLKDIGISAFHGANATDGALGGFLHAVRSKKVTPGSFLLIESLDRLSRQQVFKSFGLFSEIITAGIKVVTLADRKVYDSEPDLGDMISSIVSMERAHEESKKKSLRISAAWTNKRVHVDTKILTAKTKGWLRAKSDRTGFELIPARVKVVRQIFSMAADLEMGADSIARKLNKLKMPSFAKGNGWHQASVLRLLKDRSVLGEMVPHVMVDGKRTPTKQVVPDYFPPIIEAALFHRVQAGLETRRQVGGGRKGEGISNIFSKIVHCGWCGSNVHMINRGQPKGSRSLVCDGAKRGVNNCKRSYWPYAAFEHSFLTYISEIDLSSLTGDTVGRQQRDDADREIQEVEGRLQEVRLQRERVFALILGDEPTDFLKSKLRDLDEEVAALDRQMAGLRENLKNLDHESEAFTRGKAEVAQMIRQVQSGADDSFAIRSALSARLRDLVKHVFIWSGPVRIDVGMKGKITHEVADRCYSVNFKNGTNKLITPMVDDPARVMKTPDGRMVGSHPGVREEVTRRYTADPGAWEDFALIEAV